MSKNRLMIAAMLIFVAIPLLYGGFVIFGKDIIYMVDGRVIEADEVTRLNGTVYYIQGNEMRSIASDGVAEVVHGDYGITNIPDLLRYHFGQKRDPLFNLLLIMVGALAATALYLVLTGGGRRLAAEGPNTDDDEEETDGDAPRDIGLEFDFGMEIVHFFRSVFMHQLGAAKHAPTRIASRQKDHSGRNYIYEIYVRHDGRWHSRRMTIGPIGEGTRSKSRCYYVIFDVHMVIKVPTVPIADFDAYMERIRQEKRIADKLAPRECLVPRISTIMRRIQKFANEASLSVEQLEENYIMMMESREELKRFLKIGDTHVYFMDLSRYYFLGSIIGGMHDRQALIANEIKAHPGLLWRAHEFEGRYGPDGGSIRKLMKAVYHEYDSRVADLQEKHLPKTDRHPFALRSWFLNQLANGAPGHMEPHLPRTFRRGVGAVLEAVMAEHQAVVDQYRQMVGRFVEKRSLSANAPKMGGIVSNLLDLLDWLCERGIAVRDLKPDNLLAAGDPAQFPHFLGVPEAYNIGLIDLETAVDISPGPRKTISQPMLAGTWYYATPFHFAPNTVLTALFGDLSRHFRLQDWYAMTAVIYEVIVGAYLFAETGRRMSRRIHKITARSAAPETFEALFREAGDVFLPAAEMEMQSKCAEHAEVLGSIRAAVPRSFRRRLREELAFTVGLLDRHTADGKRDAAESRVDMGQAVRYLKRLEAIDEKYPAVEIIEMMFLVVKYGMRAA